jgi:hypothetical protein
MDLTPTIQSVPTGTPVQITIDSPESAAPQNGINNQAGIFTYHTDELNATVLIRIITGLPPGFPGYFRTPKDLTL